jgi:hypothetical protein
MHVTAPELRGNTMLANLSPAVWKSLIDADLSMVEVRAGSYLGGPGSLRYVYFPVSCVVSVLGQTFGKDRIEVAIIGRDHNTGIAIANEDIGAAYSFQAFCSGTAYRIGSAQFREALKESQFLYAMTMESTHSLFVQAASMAADVRHLNYLQQLAKFIVTHADAVRGMILHITQQEVASLLGSRRETVTTALAYLEKAGTVVHQRGIIRILDYDRLVKIGQAIP